MNINKIAKIGFIACLIISIASIGITVYAATAIWSNQVDVTVNDTYSLTLVDPADGNMDTTYIFSGVLNKNGISQTGQLITLYVSSDGTTFSSTGSTSLTDGAGAYSITWNPTTSGSFQFKTHFSSPT